MWNFKGCPHCGGDTFIEEDLDQSYEKCLQCGYERVLVRVVLKKHQASNTDELILSA